MRYQRRGIAIAVATAFAAALAVAPVAGAAKQPTVKVSGPGYTKVFKVVSCKNTGETDINLTGKAPGGDQPLRLWIVGKYRSGTLKIRGDANLNGRLTSISVGDAGNIKIKGRFTSGGVKGPFTVTGMCG